MNLLRKSRLLEEYEAPYGRALLFWCPGCQTHHSADLRTDGQRPSWSWNGDLEKPTINPSVNYVGRCHFFVVDGQFHFLGDCAHALAGCVVPMEEVSP